MPVPSRIFVCAPCADKNGQFGGIASHRYWSPRPPCYLFLSRGVEFLHPFMITPMTHQGKVKMPEFLHQYKRAPPSQILVAPPHDPSSVGTSAGTGKGRPCWSCAVLRASPHGIQVALNLGSATSSTIETSQQLFFSLLHLSHWDKSRVVSQASAHAQLYYFGVMSCTAQV